MQGSIGPRKWDVTAHEHRETAQNFCRTIVEDPVYQAAFRERALHGRLGAPLEQMMFAYAYGKPYEQRSPDDKKFLDALLTVVAQHVASEEGRAEIGRVIEEHAGAYGIRAVA